MTTPAFARALASLTAHPDDVDAWLLLGAELGGMGELATSDLVFARLGEAAVALRQPALACACAAWLGQRGQAAATLIADRLAEVYHVGAPGLDPQIRPAAPRVRTAVAPLAVADRAAAKLLASRASAAAAKAAVRAEPERYPPAPVLSRLGEAAMVALIVSARVRAVPRGEVILRQGEAAGAVYWLARGALEVTRAEVVVGALSPGAWFGEIAMVTGASRSATVRAHADSWVVEFPRQAIEAAAADEPAVAEVLAGYAWQRLLGNTLSTSSVFAPLSEAVRRALLAEFRAQTLSAGAHVIRQGQANPTLWVVVSGEVEVRHGTTVVARLGSGALLGEMSMLGDAPATADVIAIGPVAALALDRAAFAKVGAAVPAFRAEVAQISEARQRANQVAPIEADDLVI